MSESTLSTTALSKKLNIELSELFNALQKLNWIFRENDKWALTNDGILAGGKIKKDDNYGEYIIWPETISIDKIKAQIYDSNSHMLTASAIGEHFKTSAQKINLILSELGWMEKDDKRGWEITKIGKIAGGKQKEHDESGRLYVLWPDSIISNKSLTESLIENHIISLNKPEAKTNKKELNFRDKFPADHRASDGHMVRSRAEVIIDNYLYNNQITHAYERKLPIEEEVYSDFYIPMGKKAYIEFWGKEDDEQYNERKKTKIEIYKKHDFNLIELNDNDILNLDDFLPGKLLKFDIKGYM
ncbi:MAG TPA: glycerol kinase [Spirochaetota bacterium]|nr:glycerol kinase [Spirochaetota bacterium]